MTEPRDPRELLGMLATRVQHFSAAPGGIPALTADDIAHAMAGVGTVKRDDKIIRTRDADRIILYGRVKYAGESDSAQELALTFRRKIATDLDIWGWRIPRPDFVLDMCALALTESVDPMVCAWCSGRGSAMVGNKVVVCDGCKGSGRRLMQARDRAKLMGCTEQAWSMSWAKRYTEMREILDWWEMILERALSRRLRSA